MSTRNEDVDAVAAPASSRPREITLKAVVLAVLLAVVLSAANAYLGLKVGMTVSASIPAAVISMGIFRFFRRSSIVENNIVQTAASAGESLAAGMIFTLPALILLGYWADFPYLPVMAITLCGGVLGVLFTVPLRRALIVEKPLRFPEGVATGEVLKAGKSGGGEARSIAIAGVAGGLLKFCQTGLGVAASSVSTAVKAGGAVIGLGSELGVALLGVGYIVGINIAVLVFAGGALAWFVAIPLYMLLTDPAQLTSLTGGASGYAAAEAIWEERVRYLGVGAMAVGGIWALLAVLRPIRDSIVSSVRALRDSRSGKSGGLARTERDIPANFLGYGTLVLAVPVFLVFLFNVDAERLQIGGGVFLATITFGLLFALVAGFVFSSVAGYMAGLVGSSNNPISGVSILTLLTSSLVLLGILGTQIDFTGNEAKATVGAATAVIISAVVASAAAIAGDNMQDLKAGYIVGATPWKQQIMQIIGVVSAAVCLAPTLSVLYTAYGLGDSLPRPDMDPSQALQAPQATLMSSVSEGVFLGGLPWTMIGLGALVAVALIALDQLLARRGASFRTPVLAVAVGLYLPLELSVPIFIGGLLAVATARARRRRGAEGSERRGVLFASGLITGEALVGILLAIPFAAAQSAEVFMIGPQALGVSEGAFTAGSNVLGIAAFVFFVLWLYRVAARGRG
ncbi:OPT family oligopeptide transporter [Salinifilum ghardaiensis]